MSCLPFKSPVIFSALYLIILLSESRFNSKTQALTDEQTKEIQKIRAELSDAFERHEEDEIAKQGVITQPGWTQTETGALKNSNVVVTQQSLKEARKLREEINEAVKNDVLIANITGKPGGDLNIIKDFHRQYGGQSSHENIGDDMLGAVAQSDVDGLVPNTVESTLGESDIDIKKLLRLEISKRRNREVLILKSIEEDFSFNLGEDIEAWAHIWHNGTEYFIGRRVMDLQIIQKDAEKYEKAHILTIGKPISDLETYSFWNTELQQQEGIILVASENQVLWYRGDHKTGEIRLYWDWVVGTAISGLKHFTLNSKDYLVVSSNESSRIGYYALNIYQFELQSKEFWISQRLQLQHPCPEMAFLDTGREFVLAIPQNHTASIFTFNPHTENSGHIRFQLSRSFQSESIESISAFRMGGRSYLALGGLQPQILLYQQGKFVPKTILGNNFGRVELFFPIPVRTYRDDLLLLVQHSVDFGSHNVTVLETLIWDGEAFEATVPAPCQMGSHVTFGVGCMLDIERDAGLKGATLLKRGNEIFVLVPRHRAESGLFHLHTELLGRNSELLDLQEIFEFFKSWVKEEEELIETAQKFLIKADISDPKSTALPRSLKLLETPELHFNGDVSEIYVNDYKWTNADSQVNIEHLIDEIELFGLDLISGRHRRDASAAASEQDDKTTVDGKEMPSFDMLDTDNADVMELIVDKVNGEEFYIQDGSLNFEGILNIANLRVLNDINVRHSRQTVVAVEELRISGELEFDEINGQAWQELHDKLVFRNKPLSLTNLEVEGEVVVEDSLKIDILNDLQFPGEYLWANGPQSSIVTAEKVFNGTLAANAVDTKGLINEVDPSDAITLSETQNWTGLPTFADLEILGSLEINGSAHGQGLDDFPSNPTLEEANTITALCNFANLQILGPLILSDGEYDNKNLSLMLQEILQRPEDPNDELIISSVKNFNTVEFPIDFHILAQSVNNIPLRNFVTLNTNQSLNITSLKGNFFFNDLHVNGTFANVNITDILRNAIRIDSSEIALNTQLNFSHDIKAQLVNATETLNDINISKGYQTLSEDLFVSEAEFENLKGNLAEIKADITGEGKLNEVDLKAFLKNERIWSSESSQPSESSSSIARNIFINELILEDGLEADRFHNIEASTLMKFFKDVDTLPGMIIDGKIKVDQILVTGDVQVNKLNDLHFDEDIQMTVIWLDRSNYLNTNWTFAWPMKINGNLFLNGNFNDRDFRSFIDDIVFRSNDEAIHLISAPKNFKGNVKVLENTQVRAVNGIPIEYIANKRFMRSFKGNLTINGNLIVKELFVNDHLNEYSMSNLTKILRYDDKRKAFVLLGNVSLPNQMYLNDLTIYGDLNEIKDLPGFFENLVYKNNECQLNGNYNFTGRVNIENGASIENLNGLNLLELFDNMVFINALEPVIVESPIEFEDAVHTTVLNIRNSLRATSISRCSLTDWQENTLLLNRPQTISKRLNFAPGTLNNNRLYAKFMNAIDLSKIITLNTEQNLSIPLNFSQINLDGVLNVTGTVNNVYLEKEYENSVWTYGDQHISTPLILQTATVLQNLKVKQPINPDMLDLNNLATLHGDLVIESPVYFRQINVPYVETEDLISGIDFTKWYETALWLRDKPTQVITGNWSVRSLQLKSGPSMPGYIVDGERVTRDDKSFEELYLKAAKMLSKHAKRSYVIKYLEERHLELLVETGFQIERVFEMQKNDGTYLLINVGCLSMLFEWSKGKVNFEKIGVFESGKIDKLLIIPEREGTRIDLKFITNSQIDNNCQINGTHLWSLTGQTILHLHELQVNVTAMQAGQEYNTFYTAEMNQIRKFTLIDGNDFQIQQLVVHKDMDFKNYYFLPAASDMLLSMANGSHIIEVVELKEWGSSEDRVIEQNFNLSLALPQAADTIEGIVENSKSVLKPDINLARQLTFEDFKSLIKIILEDLHIRLDIVINMTQLTLPASDLYDEHLKQDFIAIMEELRIQKMYPSDFFEGISVQSFELSDDVAQVLAARTVYVIWPVIIEIVEIHGYLRSNDTQEHPILRCILNQLGSTVRDVLHTVHIKPAIVKNELLIVGTLNAVIERIQELQTYLSVLNEELELEIFEDKNFSKESDLNEIFVANANQSKNLDAALTIPISSNVLIRIFENHELPDVHNGEIIEMLVGPEKRPRILYAITRNHVKFVPDHHVGIVLYSNIRTGNAFQTLAAHNPRSMATLRIRDITFLAYIDDCCTVKILQYKGIMGFIEFANFEAGTHINDLLLLELPAVDVQGKKFYLITVLSEKLKFYEFVIVGFKELPNATLNCINCKY